MNFYGNLSKTDILLYPEKDLDSSLEINILNAVNKLKSEKPIQYILGETEFFSNRFFVDENVLIPRQETEELVDWIISETTHNKPISILDIGCGSGCISISLAKALPDARVTALDISEKAIAIAQKNAIENNVNIHFLEKNILEVDFLPEKYDIIVSNPPYVRELEKKEIHNNVLNYEPHLALFVSNEKPLIFYEKITQLAKLSLNEGGKLFFEINQYLGEETKNTIIKEGFEKVELKNDLLGNARMIKAE
ncbi:release factor glutamine methyltransferase [Capnocytophaga cynodegmi]|nr:release factor glutamine methyltransferase [Capnocytophaga cynodegmi]